MAWTLAIVSALLFYSGYYTLTTFYRYFGIPLSLLDLPAWTFPVNSHVLIIWVLLLVILLGPLLVSLLGWVDRLYARKGLTRPPKRTLSVRFIAYLAALGLVAFSFYSWSLGTRRAMEFVTSNSALSR